MKRGVYWTNMNTILPYVSSKHNKQYHAALGFEKDMRFGIIHLKDYDGLGLEVCRQKGSGLFVVRIDRFIPDHQEWTCLENVLAPDDNPGTDWNRKDSYAYASTEKKSFPHKHANCDEEEIKDFSIESMKQEINDLSYQRFYK